MGINDKSKNLVEVDKKSVKFVNVSSEVQRELIECITDLQKRL